MPIHHARRPADFLCSGLGGKAPTVSHGNWEAVIERKSADMNWPTESGEFHLGDFPLQSGEVLRDAKLVWKSYGTLNAARDNVILYPCSYGAKHGDMEWLIGPDGILDPTRWFIIIPNMFSNGALLRRRQHAGLSAGGDTMGQCDGAAPAAARAFRHRAAACRLRLLDGRAAGLSLGRDVPRCGGPRHRGLQQRQDRGAQQGVSSPACCAPSRRRRSISAMAASPPRRSARCAPSAISMPAGR